MKPVRLTTILLCLLPGVGYLLVFFGMPLVRVVVNSFSGRGADAASFTLDPWITLLTTPVYLDGLRFSVWLAIAPTALSLLIALPLSALMQANETSRKFFGSLYRIPLVVPGIVAAFLVLVMLDRGGMASRILTPLGITLPRLVRDEWGLGAIIASSWKNIPFMTLIISGSMAAISKDVLSAARTLGASRLTILWRIQLPLAQPGITAAVLLTFISSLGSFVVPNLLGPSYPLPLSVHMYTEGFTKGNWPLVYAMGTLLSIVAVGVLLTYYAIIGSLSQSDAQKRAGA
ncbi:ABC transporter permease [Nitratireductor aquimarinus]|uniref:ABC transporter permease n=1 Tax=Nitratireductor aquimarinus TaxID=889300 RepID=A0ABU4AP20_9HYPH|nr:MULTISPECIES: ABC transporter permease [Nitratireductor]MBN7775924.1 ABC transporter permease [Nitratireductor pacificus]MBN7780587.1 ABC transporter permease [Nitratireductor pacificus]MBN7789394.1 ABC transporter permease [Nitratireductor aquimarinus]MBY6098672.1 ABC transporter permease [Nitratireductor aquimarinus]MCA1259558.1 ABC transporter permease [Nitratireductor aquimarinus]